MPLPQVAVPTRTYFDPYNSSATGHQICPSRLAGTPSWRASRSLKLSHQFSAGAPGQGGVGGKRIYDTVGAGSKDFGKDARRDIGGCGESTVARSRNKRGVGDVGVMLGARTVKDHWGDRKVARREEKLGKLGGGDPPTKRQRVAGETKATSARMEEEAICALASKNASSTLSRSDIEPPPIRKRGIFDSLNFYVNGSTAPLVSDHKLKYLLVEHGGNISIGLGRRTVTHVILGKANGYGGKGGAGGGLAGSKIQKEIRRVGGKGVKYVDVEWALESIKAGKRLSEAGFSNLSTAPKGVKSVYGMFKEEPTNARDGGLKQDPRGR